MMTLSIVVSFRTGEQRRRGDPRSLLQGDLLAAGCGRASCERRAVLLAGVCVRAADALDAALLLAVDVRARKEDDQPQAQ